MRVQTRLLLAAAVLATLLPVLPARAAHLAGGPIVLMGIDAEDGGVGAHGPIATYENVVGDLLASATKGSGILVLGGGKSATDHVTTFWNRIGTDLGVAVTHVNGAAVGTVAFGAFELVAVVSSEDQTFSGGLTDAENAALDPRDADIAAHVNSGGGLLGFSQDGLALRYPYLDALGTFTIATGRGDANVTATADGQALGLDSTTLDVCCWHDDYRTFPSFLVPLATYVSDGLIAAIGGARVLVLPDCTPGTLTAAVTRPAAGRLYEDDIDIGPSATSTASARGATLTLAASTSATAHQVTFLIDSLAVGVDTTAPYSVTAPLPAVLGPHTVKVVAISEGANPCRATAEAIFEIVCFDAVPAVTRPAAGRLYQNNVDVGSSGIPDAAVIGGMLTVEATSSNPSRTQRIDFSVDLAPIGSDLTSPYQASFDATPLAPGLHTVTARLFEFVAGCDDVVTVNLRKTDPSILAVGHGLRIANAVPTEAEVRAGGALATGKGGSQQIRIADQTLAPVDYAQAIVDKADGAVAGSLLSASASSVVTRVSLLGGAITADVLESRVRASANATTFASSAVDDGSRIVGLRVLATPVDVVRPNTVVEVPGIGRLVLQETLPVVDGPRAEITVNALHLFLDPGYPASEIVLGSAHAGVNAVADAFDGPAADLIHHADDLDSGADAGATTATAMPIAPGIYSAAISEGDLADVYSFPAGQGDRILVTVKPAERTRLEILPLPSLPALAHERPSVNVFLRDPAGDVRARSVLAIAGSDPQKVELNADIPFAPAGAKATWTVEVARQGRSLDGFYTIEFAIAPVLLAAQNDAGQAGDASDSCVAPRMLPGGPVSGEIEDTAFSGVIRDADSVDFYGFQATAGRVLTVLMKPDEADDGADFNLYLYGPASPGGPTDCVVPIAQSTFTADQAKALPEIVGSLPVFVSGRHVFEVRRVNAVANYYVNVNATNPLPTIPGNDARTGADAGDSCATATPVGAGVYEGTMIDLPDQDTDDWYSVTLAANQDLTVAMKPSDPSDFDLELYTPACTLAALDPPVLNYQPLSVPELVRIEDAPAGTYRIRVLRDPEAGAGNYMLGIAVTP